MATNAWAALVFLDSLLLLCSFCTSDVLTRKYCTIFRYFYNYVNTYVSLLLLLVSLNLLSVVFHFISCGAERKHKVGPLCRRLIQR